MLQVLDLGRGTIARQHDLLVPLVESIERMKKLFLNPLFARKKLDVVDQKDVGLPVFFRKRTSWLF